MSPFKYVLYRAKRLQTMQRIGNGLARAAAVRAMQPVNATDPRTWEVSGLSQNGEDGVSEFLTQRIVEPNRYFVEIGASDGTENNSSWFAIARRWSGLMIEGDPQKADYCRFIMGGVAVAVQVESCFVCRENAADLFRRFRTLEPDFFSLDIDGIDWYVASALLELGFKPRVWVVEYNSCFGPERSVTIPYKANFNFREAHPTALYYGASIQAWRDLLCARGYRFVTVESNGVNAFFVRPECLDQDFLSGLKSRNFEENFYQQNRHGGLWQKQLDLIKDLPLVNVAGGAL